MTTDSLPAPPLPADADLTHYDDMPLEVRRLRDSGIAGETNAEIFRCAVLLWCVAWHQLPAGSLPKGDDELCRLVGLGRDHKTWRKIKAGVLRGWREFSDGRLYHKVVAEKAIEGWNRSRVKNWAMACDRLRKENKAREERHEPKLAMPQRPAELPMEWPEDIVPPSIGTAERLPTENRLKGIEGNGIEPKKDPPPVAQSPPVAEPATRAGDDHFDIPDFLRRQPSRIAQPIAADWMPSQDAQDRLIRDRPDMTPEIVERRMGEFRNWCAEKATQSHNPDATWFGFMKRTHVEQPRDHDRSDRSVAAGLAGFAEAGSR